MATFATILTSENVIGCLGVWAILGLVVNFLLPSDSDIPFKIAYDAAKSKAQKVFVVFLFGPLFWIGGLGWLLWKGLGRLP